MESNLINEVSKYPNLYDQNLDSYKDNELKNKIWGQITSDIMGGSDIESVEKVKTRWKSLRDSFLRNLKRTNLQGNKKVKPWKYSEQMQFLLPYVGGKAASLIREDINEDSGVVNDEDFDIYETNIYSIKNKRFKPHPLYSDPIDSFFIGIAQTVKNLTPYNQAYVKKAIANLVMDTEINELEDSNWNKTQNTIYEPRVEMKIPENNHHSSSASVSSYSMASDA